MLAKDFKILLVKMTNDFEQDQTSAEIQPKK